MSMMKYKLQKLIKFRILSSWLWLLLWGFARAHLGLIMRDQKEEVAFGANSSHINRRWDFVMNYGKQGENFEKIILNRLLTILNRMSQFFIFEEADYRIAKKVGFNLPSISFLKICTSYNTVCILKWYTYCRENASAFLSPVFVLSPRPFPWFLSTWVCKIESMLTFSEFLLGVFSWVFKVTRTKNNSSNKSSKNSLCVYIVLIKKYFYNCYSI